MNRRLQNLAVAASAMVLIATGTVWHLAFRMPAAEPLPLPGHLVALTDAEGRRLLTDKVAGADYPSLTVAFEPQRRPAFCGVASSVTVLNALRRPRVPLTQGGFFTDLPTELRVTFRGMTVDELGELLRTHGSQAEVFHAADTTIDAFRTKASENLARAGDYVLVNYQRAVLGQRAGGHISPLGAYHAGSDRFLVLDVAAYRYPPVWVRTQDLWNAMDTVDSDSGRTRGFVLVRERGSAPPSSRVQFDDVAICDAVLVPDLLPFESGSTPDACVARARAFARGIPDPLHQRVGRGRGRRRSRLHTVPGLVIRDTARPGLDHRVCGGRAARRKLSRNEQFGLGLVPKWPAA